MILLKGGNRKSAQISNTNTDVATVGYSISVEHQDLRHINMKGGGGGGAPTPRAAGGPAGKPRVLFPTGSPIFTK
eukprot:scaffold67969_cov31-Tisochrysis_lutea.AAC.2